MGDATEENYLPGPLLDTGDVIIVTGNYRVGPLGFMCLEDEVVPGNLALWDQRLMLLWIQENIAVMLASHWSILLILSSHWSGVRWRSRERDGVRE